VTDVADDRPSGTQPSGPAAATGPQAADGSRSTPAGLDRWPSVAKVSTPICLEYRFSAGLAQSRFLRGLAEGRFLGQRCPRCGQVYVPPRGSCPTDGVPTEEEVELGNTGTVTTFCIVNVPFRGQAISIPYVCAQILLDGANISFMGLIQECDAADVRMGMRVEAVWVPKEELRPSWESVRWFRPTGEPDAPYESYAAYL
jgi:uncharacterized OB-fold protein